ncbi:MAG: phage holin family protein [bacterium]
MHYIERALEHPYIKLGLAIICSIFSFLFGDFNLAAQTFIILLITDLITGITKGIYFKKYSSRILRKSMLKVITYGFAIFTGHMATQIGLPLRDLVLFWAGLTELSSIIENLDELGFEIPDFITNKLDQTKEKKFGD